jgi:hypothetical protein
MQQELVLDTQEYTSTRVHIRLPRSTQGTLEQEFATGISSTTTCGGVDVSKMSLVECERCYVNAKYIRIILKFCLTDASRAAAAGPR